MILKKLLCLFTLSILLASCAGSKLNTILKQGETLQEDYKVTMPFEYRGKHILLKVTIQGEIYDFILDSGASNNISKELAEKLNITTLGAEDVGDINGNVTELEYTKLDDIQIGGINFQNTIASIWDINATDFSCLEVDGLIGANLMRHAVWDIDFPNQTITITNNEKKLNFPSEYAESKMYIGAASVASITTKVNGERSLNNVIDLGNSGKTILKYPNFKSQKESQKITKFIKGTGSVSLGAFGNEKSQTSYNARVDEIKIGDHIITNEIVAVKQSSSSNLGLQFFKNYRLILNWGIKKMKMIQQKTDKKESIVGFGFAPKIKNNKLYVSFLYNESKTAKLLHLGDQIISINTTDYSQINQTQKCSIMMQGLLDKVTNKMQMTVLRNGEELEFQLERETLL